MTLELNENLMNTPKPRFQIKEGIWYACEFIGDEFNEDCCSYSPIRVDEIKPLKSGSRRFSLNFYHANYPEGVRDKCYTLQTIERGESFIIAKSIEHNDPARLLQIYEINGAWMKRHFPSFYAESDDIQQWLSRNC
jgi:hypothetical protein